MQEYQQGNRGKQDKSSFYQASLRIEDQEGLTWEWPTFGPYINWTEELAQNDGHFAGLFKLCPSQNYLSCVLRKTKAPLVYVIPNVAEVAPEA